MTNPVKIFFRLFFLLIVMAACSDSGPAAELPDTGPSAVRIGEPQNVTASLQGPALYLAGRGSPEPSSFNHFVKTVSAGGVADVTVISASFPSGGSQTPECDRIIGLESVNSCTTITMTSRDEAGHQKALDLIRKSDIVYFAGGNQCNYMNWRDTELVSEISALYERGGGVGGGSAGLAIQGDYVYDGCTGSVRSEEALNDPYDPLMSLSPGMFGFFPLQGWITDSHFSERGRLGRLIAFMARIMDEKETTAWHGIGLDDNAVIVIGPNGTGTAFVATSHVVRTTGKASNLVPGQPLSIAGIEVYTIRPGESIHFPDFVPETEPVLMTVEEGRLN